MSRLYTFAIKIGNYIRLWPEETKLYAFSLLILSSLFFVPSNKALLLVTFLLVAGVHLIWNNITLAILYGYILLLPFQNGKGLTFLVVPSEYVYGHIPFEMTPTFSMSDVLLTLLLYVYLRSKIFQKTKHTHTRIGVQDILLGIFLIATIAAGVMSNIPLLSCILTLQLTSYVVIYYYIQEHHLTPWVKKIILPILASICTFEGFWVVLQTLNKGPLGKSIENLIDPALASNLAHAASEDASFFRMQGTFSHPNFLGFFMAVTTPILLYYSISNRVSYVGKIVSSIGFVSGVTALVLSGSRASWVFFALAVVVLLRIPKLRSVVTVIPVIKLFYKTCILLCAAIVPIIIIPRLFHLAVTFDVGGGAYYRWYLLEKAVIIALQHPFGVGLGIFPQILMQEIGGFTSYPTQPHNLIAQILVASGFIGVISFLGFITMKLTHSVVMLRSLSGHQKIERIICLTSIGVFFSLSMLYPVLTEQQIFGWLWILLCIIGES